MLFRNNVLILYHLIGVITSKESEGRAKEVERADEQV